MPSSTVVGHRRSPRLDVLEAFDLAGVSWSARSRQVRAATMPAMTFGLTGLGYPMSLLRRYGPRHKAEAGVRGESMSERDGSGFVRVKLLQSDEEWAASMAR
jgi:hypothetical protein